MMFNKSKSLYSLAGASIIATTSCGGAKTEATPSNSNNAGASENEDKIKAKDTEITGLNDQITQKDTEISNLNTQLAALPNADEMAKLQKQRDLYTFLRSAVFSRNGIDASGSIKQSGDNGFLRQIDTSISNLYETLTVTKLENLHLHIIDLPDNVELTSKAGYDAICKYITDKGGLNIVTKNTYKDKYLVLIKNNAYCTISHLSLSDNYPKIVVDNGLITLKDKKDSKNDRKIQNGDKGLAGFEFCPPTTSIKFVMA